MPITRKDMPRQPVALPAAAPAGGLRQTSVRPDGSGWLPGRGSLAR